MKVIPLSEAKANLSRYGHLCHDEPVIVTVNGVPSFQLVPLNEDELIDQLLEHNPKYRRLLASRLREPSVSAKDAARRL
jgi:antitoxin (DNA-binding transcriptional repressor) of toxin-antitoxin stability system